MIVELERHILSLQDQITKELLAWAAMESPSTDAVSTTRMADAVATHMTKRGAEVTLHPGKKNGAIVQATWPGRGGKPILLLGHHDTVHPHGSLQRNPPRVENGRCYGPGVYDMKGGLLLAGAALEAVRHLNAALPHPVILLSTADEEISSIESRALIEDVARESAAVFVLEPAFPTGAVKTARKGAGTFTVTAHGRPAHAGAAHELGVNAIVELAHQALKLSALTDYARGITINVGQVVGGSASNTVPASATMQVDVRVARAEDAAWLTEQINGLHPVLPGARLAISGEVDRPPMERSAGTARLFEHARQLAARIKLDLQETSTGGGSDGNFTAALGIPTLDGLGVCGDGAHTDDEFALIESFAPRAALLGALLLAI